MRRHLLAEELLADRPVIGAVADVGQVGVDLDDIRHGAATGLDLRLQALKSGAGMTLENDGMNRAAVRPIGVYLSHVIHLQASAGTGAVKPVGRGGQSSDWNPRSEPGSGALAGWVNRGGSP